MEPIVILAAPRSGSSMTAGLFANHGVWVGPYRAGDRINAKGHFECLPIKRALIEHCGRIVTAGQLADKVPGWREVTERTLCQNGYAGGPWLVKHSALYYPVWHEFNPKFICARRADEGVRASERATGMIANIKAHKAAMDAVDGVDVFTDDIVAGDYSSLERAFDFCGIRMDRAIVDDFVEPSLWHYAPSS